MLSQLDSWLRRSLNGLEGICSSMFGSGGWPRDGATLDSDIGILVQKLL